MKRGRRIYVLCRGRQRGQAEGVEITDVSLLTELVMGQKGVFQQKVWGAQGLSVSGPGPWRWVLFGTVLWQRRWKGPFRMKLGGRVGVVRRPKETLGHLYLNGPAKRSCGEEAEF